VVATSAGHLEALRWSTRWSTRRWAIEDCRHLSRRLSTDLLVAGEAVLTVPPKLMAGARRGARTRGKSDPIDALAVARAPLREPNLPAAQLDGPARELRLLVDHREDLVTERTRVENRLRWHLHELQPGEEPPARSLNRHATPAALEATLAARPGLVARLARELVVHCHDLTVAINALEREIRERVSGMAPGSLLCSAAEP
jgi:transposase